jgi:hypothetical protein
MNILVKSTAILLLFVFKVVSADVMCQHFS